MTAPVVPTLQRNPLGIAALVLSIVAVAVPPLIAIITPIVAVAQGATGDDIGWAGLGAFVFGFVAIPFIAPVAIAGVVLAIIALTRPGRKKWQAVVALVLGLGPAIGIFFLPAAIDTLF